MCSFPLLVGSYLAIFPWGGGEIRQSGDIFQEALGCCNSTEGLSRVHRWGRQGTQTSLAEEGELWRTGHAWPTGFL